MHTGNIKQEGDIVLREVSIEIIRRCLNNCMHCSSMSGPACREMIPLNKFKEVVQHAKMLGAETICLSGGEPFLHEQIIERIEYVSQIGLNCFVYTSGIVEDRGRAISISTDIFSRISTTVTKVIFNVEASREETYDLIMGTTGCFEIMKTSISNAVATGIHTEAHFVPMRLNINEIDATINLCKLLGILTISFLRLVPHGRAALHANKLCLTYPEMCAIKKQLRELSETYGSAIRIGVPLSTDEVCHKCEAACGKINIRYDGRVFPCEVFKNNQMQEVMGEIFPDNIYENSFYTIYKESKYLNHIRELSVTYPKTAAETCIGQYMLEWGERKND